MKVVHVLKRIETIDQDVKDLRKLEKTIRRDKSFATPIFMSIEKQINILLGERVKLFELRIENPPKHMVEEIEGKDEPVEIKPRKKQVKKSPKKLSRKSSGEKPQKLNEEIPMLTQDQIDLRFESLKKEHAPEEQKTETKSSHDLQDNTNEDADDDTGIKLLDIALEKGTVNHKEVEAEKERKVRFFRENFPTD